MTIDLTGRSALVTGAGSGIGRAVAVVLARYGARVAVAGRRADALEETARLVRDAGGEALAVPTDVSVEADVERLVDATVAAFGGLDLACNNAAIVGPEGAITDLTAADFDLTMGTNLRGAFLCLKHELAAMADGAAVVNVSSANATLPERGAALYCTSKAGLDMLTQVAALENADRGIRVNSIRPGFVVTPMHDGVLESIGGATPENVAMIEGMVPLRRRADPEEIAEAVAWLCSDDARYVTGSMLTVDGGISISPGG
ncbi:glucose 1-dehydrogenase [Nocardioides aquiterrae]|uniref:Glucose 1-dehydrogenase n=1 Tax=Nocardioides aquiterrae TaxID=203799 RepID=A0ABN1UCK3_9ACTN